MERLEARIQSVLREAQHMEGAGDSQELAFRGSRVQ